jgi:aerobic-type carbon monoxide dehydrogenase small subunit (CoxS/CutS family)
VKLHFTVDGRHHRVEAAPAESLMAVLRRIGYQSVKNGCDNGDCGSCAVLIDDRAVNACLVLAARADGQAIETVEGLDTNGELHPVQQAFLDLGGIQCGFCTPGMVLLTLDLLEHNPDPSEAEIRDALAGNYCRCTGYVKQIEAMLASAAEMREAGE